MVPIQTAVGMFESRLLMLQLNLFSLSLFVFFMFMPLLNFPVPFLQPTDSQPCLKCRLQQPSSLKMADCDGKEPTLNDKSLLFLFQPFFNPQNTS